MADLERLRKPSKRWVYSGTVSADGMLSFTDGGVSTTWLDLGDVDWERIIVDMDVTAVTGTVTTLDLKFKTCNYNGGTQPTSTTMNLTTPAGTAVAMTQVTTSTTREIKSAQRANSSGASNAGRFIGFFADVAVQSGGSYTVRVSVEATK